MNFLNFCPSREPTVVPPSSRFPDRIQLVEEGWHKASRTTDSIRRGGCVLGGDFEHEHAREHGEEFFGPVDGQEGAGDGAEGASGLM